MSSKLTLPKHLDWQGHRGARGLVPENSIPSFIKALEYPVKTLELDVAVSKEGIVIVTHDPYFHHDIASKPNGEPVTKKESEQLLIYEMTYEEIKTYDCGSRGHERFPEQVPQSVFKPSLVDMVKAIESHCQQINRDLPYYNIEIKSRPDWDNKMHPEPERYVKWVLNGILEANIASRCNLQSFDVRILREIKKQMPEMVTALLIWDGLKRTKFDNNIQNLGYQPEIYSPYYKYVNRKLVEKAHALGMKVIPWTVNEVSDMKKLIEDGVDGIITDYPNKILEIQ